MEESVVRHYFEDLRRCYVQADRYRYSTDVHILTEIHQQLRHHCDVLDNLWHAVRIDNAYMLVAMYDIIVTTCNNMEDVLSRLNDNETNETYIMPVTHENSDVTGRPKYNVTVMVE